MQKIRLSSDHNKLEEAKQLSRQSVHMQVVSTSGKGARASSSHMSGAPQHHISMQSANPNNNAAGGVGGTSASQNPLTREMIVSKHKLKSNDISHLKNVNLCLFEIDNLTILREMPNLEIVSLSHNKVSTLKDLSYCQKLQEIYIRKNAICDLQEVGHLARLPHLRVLWLSHNPCAEHQYYRPYIVRKLQALVKLDNAEVKKEERQAAARLNFDQIFREHSSYIAPQVAASSGGKQS